MLPDRNGVPAYAVRMDTSVAELWRPWATRAAALIRSASALHVGRKARHEAVRLALKQRPDAPELVGDREHGMPECSGGCLLGAVRRRSDLVPDLHEQRGRALEVRLPRVLAGLHRPLPESSSSTDAAGTLPPGDAVRNRTTARPAPATYAGRLAPPAKPLIPSDRQLTELVGFDESWCHIAFGGIALCGEPDRSAPHLGQIVKGRCTGCRERKCPDCLRRWTGGR